MKWITALLGIWSMALIAGCFYRLDLDDDIDDDDDGWEETLLIVSSWEDWSADTTVAIVQPFIMPSIAGVSTALSLEDAASTVPDAGEPSGLELVPHELAIEGAHAELTSTFTSTAGADCEVRDVTGQVTGADRALDVEVRGYLRCGLACPLSGVVILRDGSKSARVTFDGSDRARLDRTGGAVEYARLDCAR